MPIIGQPRLSDDRRYFVDPHGNPFFYFADTFWYGMSKRASRKDFCAVIDDRQKKGVNVIQIVVGFVPESSLEKITMEDSNSSPLTSDGKINASYFYEVEWRLHYIVKKGMIPCIVGGWGWHIDQVGVDKIKHLWTATLETLGNLPAFLCLCGEIDLFPVTTQLAIDEGQTMKKRIQAVIPARLYVTLRDLYRRIHPLPVPQDKLSARLQDWREVVSHIRKVDKEHRLLTVHVKGLVTGATLYDDTELFDYDVIQSGHTYDSQEQVIKVIRDHTEQGRLILNMEPAYEGILGQFWGKDQVDIFLSCVHAGAKGHAYGANGVWQMSTKTDSFLAHWGKSDWKEALQYEGLILLSKEVKKYCNTMWWRAVVPNSRHQ